MSRTEIAFITLIAGLGVAGLVVTTHAQAPSQPGPAQAATGTITILVNGQPIATGSVINLTGGSGVVASAKADPAISGTDIELDSNTAVLASLDQVHAGPNACVSTNGTTTYTCKLPNRALPAYGTGPYLLIPDVACPANCTVDIDGRGALSIKQADGITDPDGAITARQAYWIWYDGTLMRLTH
jgi:hypothetical protein